MTLPGLADRYTVHARLYPALIGGGGLIAAAFYVIPWQPIGLPHLVATLVSAVVIYALADLARRAGKRIEPNLFKAWGGKPSTAMLRHADDQLEAGKKARYQSFLAGKIGRPAPSARLEKSRPAECDGFYDDGGDWLRGQTRDVNKFPLLFAENVTYGFRRNFLGLKWPVIGADAMVFLGAVVAGHFRLAGNDTLSKLPVVATIVAAHAAFLLVVATQASVRQAANQYARQLLLSCDELPV